jgi:hypothetical protein
MGAARYMAGNVDEIVFILATSVSGGAWDWEEVEILAALQIAKIQSVRAAPKI